MKSVKTSAILIVDDKPANIIALENLLADKTRTFLQATNGKDALKLALNKAIDLIILDVKMPDMDGFEVAKILNSNSRTRDIPIIFASAEKTEQKSMMKGYDEGAIDFLLKPLDPEITRAKVAVLLKIQMQKKELMEKNQALEKSELLINNSADIIGIIDPVTFKLEEINKTFTDILGYSLEEAKENSLFLYLDKEDHVLLEKLSKKKEEKLSFETRLYCKDRSVKWLQWHVMVKYNKWFVNARDITETKKVEKIRNYLATIVLHSNEGIYMHDYEGNIISWNKGAEKIYGYSEEEALHMQIWNLIPEFLKEEKRMIIDSLMEGMKIQTFETKRITKYGKIIDVELTVSLINDPDNRLQTIAITDRDITGQKIAEEKIKQLNIELQQSVEQLKASNKEIESFSYSVSHDLRAPLRIINGYAGMLEEDYKEKFDEEGKRLIGVIQSNSLKMSQLIDDLLALSRLGRKELDKTMLNTNELVRNVIGEIENSDPHHAKIKIHKLPACYGDYSLLKQVWINLISNAIKYSNKKDQPVIEIASEESGKNITYYVKDNGAGFDMKYVDKLFGVFQRLHTSSDFSGTGIGLAIVQRIISRHNGNVRAEGKVNEGSTFYFTLPVKTVKEETKENDFSTSP